MIDGEKKFPLTRAALSTRRRERSISVRSAVRRRQIAAKTQLALALLALAMVGTQARSQVTYIPYAFTNLAGMPTVSGTNDGTGSAARFNAPAGVAVDSAGNIYVGDRNNNTIRKVTPTGVVATLAGSAGLSGSANGTGNAARFKQPSGVAVDSAGNVYVADRDNNTIRKITRDGKVTTLAGSAGLAGTNDGVGSTARFDHPRGVAVDGATNVYVGDFGNNTIRRITPAGVVTTLAGSAGLSGTNDGIGNAARFTGPFGIAVDSATNVYVVDLGNNTVRRVTPAGVVTTLGGSAGLSGTNDGIGNTARFNGPVGVALDPAGNVYVAEYANQGIRKITPAGVVATLAGSAGLSGTNDGIGSLARFSGVWGVAVDSAGNLYVTDQDFNQRITKGTPLLQFDTSWGLVVSNASFQGRLIGPASNTFVLEGAVNLAAWTPIQTNTIPSGSLDISVSVGTSQSKFFRARLVP